MDGLIERERERERERETLYISISMFIEGVMCKYTRDGIMVLMVTSIWPVSGGTAVSDFRGKNE